MRSSSPPDQSEHAPYFRRYVHLVRGDDVFDLLAHQFGEMTEIANSWGRAQECRAYAPGKWTVREVFGHVMDVERFLAYWASCFAHRDREPRPAIDCEAYVIHARYAERTLQSILAEFSTVRAATLALYEHLSEEMLGWRGVALEHDMTARAALYVISGHQRHHLDILNERYRPLLTTAQSAPAP